MKDGTKPARRNRAILLGSALLGSSLAAGTAQAQQAAAADAPTATKLQAVEVTGSRIKKSEGTGETPVLTLTAAELQATGITSIGDIIQRLGVSGSSLNTKFNSAGNFGFPADGGGVGSGSTTISLRNLGAQRTLILVDGLRWVNESSASGVSGAVDLNTIPFSAIEKVEILTDGASSLYGSDAIGGVVNIITKKSQKGALARVYYGDYETGNGQTYTGNLSLGVKEKAYEFFVDLSHYRQREISSSATDQSSFPIPGTGTTFGSSSTAFGRQVFFPNGNNTYGGLCPLTDTNGDNIPDTAFCNITPNGVNSTFPSQYHGFTDADRFNFAPFNLLLTPSQRSAVFTHGRYNVNDNVRFYVKGLYQSRKSVNQAAPEPIFLGPGAGTGGLADTVGIDATNPFNPYGYSLDSSNLVLFARRPVEGGPRVFQQDVSTRYFNTGFDGSFEVFDRFFAWDVNYVNSVNSAEQRINGTYNIRRIANALGPIANCVAPCVPLNLFGGPGTITAEQLNYISFIERDSSRQTLDQVTLNLSGTIVPLPAGTLDFATGYEHRKLSGSYSPDAVVTAGESNGVPSLPTSGRYSVDEFYVEFVVPLLNKQPFAKRLDLSLASRLSDYSTFGTTIKSKVGLRWQPVTDLTLRGTYAEGFRAPSIGESFGSPARFDASIEDPCSGATGATATTCQQVFGTPVGFQQANTQISIRTGGNANLDAETSRSYTAGLVYSPSWAEKQAWSDRIDLELTFYKHKVKNAIQSPDAQTQLNRCVASGDPNSTFCQGISRGSSGDINGFDSTLRNLGVIETQGYDIGIGWNSPRYAFGKFNINWNTTYIENYRAVATDTGLEEPRGVGNEVSDSGIPRWKSTITTNWNLAPFTAGWTIRYISPLRELCGDAAAFPVCSDQAAGVNRFDPVVYHDFRAGVTLPIPYKPELTAGVNNAFNAGPPTCVSCSLNGYDASNYDLPGRFAYVQATVKF